MEHPTSMHSSPRSSHSYPLIRSLVNGNASLIYFARVLPLTRWSTPPTLTQMNSFLPPKHLLSIGNLELGILEPPLIMRERMEQALTFLFIILCFLLIYYLLLKKYNKNYINEKSFCIQCFLFISKLFFYVQHVLLTVNVLWAFMLVMYIVCCCFNLSLLDAWVTRTIICMYAFSPLFRGISLIFRVKKRKKCFGTTLCLLQCLMHRMWL